MLVALVIGANDVIAALLEHKASLAKDACARKLANFMGDADICGALDGSRGGEQQ